MSGTPRARSLVVRKESLLLSLCWRSAAVFLLPSPIPLCGHPPFWLCSSAMRVAPHLLRMGLGGHANVPWQRLANQAQHLFQARICVHV